jgi:hypothetical protein
MTAASYRLQPTEGLARCLRISLRLQSVLIVVMSVVVFLWLRSHTFTVAFDGAGHLVSTPWFRASRSFPYRLVSGIGSLVGIASTVLWLFWQHRATGNLWARRLPDLRITPAWAVGWWFIPVASLVAPIVAMWELDRRSVHGGRGGRIALLTGWWGAFLIGQLGWLVAFFAVFGSFVSAIVADAGRPRTIDLTSTIHGMAPWLLATSLVYGLAAVLASLVVDRIDRAQTAVFVEATAPPPRPDVAG